MQKQKIIPVENPDENSNQENSSVEQNKSMFRAWIDETPNRFDNSEIARVKQWIAILLLTIIPVMNIAALLRLAFSSKEEKPASLVNWARAIIIMVIIVTCAVAICIFLICQSGHWGGYGLVR